MPTGYLQIQQRDYYSRGWSPYTCKSSATVSLLHLSYLPCDAPLRPANSFGQCVSAGQRSVCIANYSTSPDSRDCKPKETAEGSATKGPAAVEKLSILQRFKRAYKEHGKILVAVHVATSVVWYGSFYAAVRW